MQIMLYFVLALVWVLAGVEEFWLKTQAELAAHLAERHLLLLFWGLIHLVTPDQVQTITLIPTVLQFLDKEKP
jgi:hypothetical protein